MHGRSPVFSLATKPGSGAKGRRCRMQLRWRKSLSLSPLASVGAKTKAVGSAHSDHARRGCEEVDERGDGTRWATRWCSSSTVKEKNRNGKWTSDIAHNLNAGLLSEFFVLWRHIYTQSLQLDSAQEDEITWTLESSGEYSASSAYTIQFSDSMCTASDIGRRL